MHNIICAGRLRNFRVKAERSEMATKTKVSHRRQRRHKKASSACPVIRESIDHLGKYFDVFNSLLRKDETF